MLNQNIPLEKFETLRFYNPENLNFVYLNVYSNRKKFDSLQEIAIGKVDILIVTESKTDTFIPTE